MSRLFTFGWVGHSGSPDATKMQRAKQERIADHHTSLGAPAQEPLAVKAIANEK